MLDFLIHAEFNRRMDDKKIIDLYGGATKLSNLLNFKTPNGARRVHNWKTRGIPAKVKLDFPEVFLLPELFEKKKK